MILSEFMEGNKKAIVCLEDKKYIVKKFIGDDLFSQTETVTEDDAETVAEYWVVEKITGEQNGN